MSLTLSEALRQVPLEAGQTYSCQVNGFWVEVRVLSAPPPCEPIDEADIRMDIGTVLPPPEASITVQGKPGVMPPPIIPEIPSNSAESFEDGPPWIVPWVELPLPGPGIRMRAKPGTQIPIDVPYIPPEENDA